MRGMELQAMLPINAQALGKDGQNIYEEMRDVYSSIYEQLKIIVGAKIDDSYHRQD